MKKENKQRYSAFLSAIFSALNLQIILRKGGS